MGASLFTSTTIDGWAREIYTLDFRRPGKSLFYVGTIQKTSFTPSLIFTSKIPTRAGTNRGDTKLRLMLFKSFFTGVIQINNLGYVE